MVKKFLVVSMLVALVVTPAISMADSSSLTASIRIGLTYEDDGTDDEIFLRDFGSRLKWKGSKDLDNGWTGVGYAEFGFDPDSNSENSSGINRTRQLWAGVDFGSGSVKVGAQYATFYDMISSHTDIAWIGSCTSLQFECDRKTRVLKYSGQASRLSWGASVMAAGGDDGGDVADQIEAGVNYNLGNWKFGLGYTSTADEGADNGGSLIGAMVGGALGPVGITLTFQTADEDFANATDDVTNITLAGTLANFYTVLSTTDSGGSATPYYATLGYTMNYSKSTLIYFEAQTEDPDVNGLDANNTLRATYKLDF